MALVDKYELNNGTSCSISPSWGCNMFSWVVDGSELIYVPENYPEAAFKITGGGNPLLFPAVGRTWDISGDKPVQGNYKIYGSDKTYFMPSHGILYFCTWNKVEEDRKADSISVRYEAIVPEKVYQENHPYKLGFSQKYVLKPSGVDLEAVITNNDDKPAPYAFGFHPYFRISNKEREGVEVRLPVKTHYMLTPDTVLMTGESEPTDGVYKLEPDIYYDHAFGDPIGNRMSLTDSKAGRVINVDFDENFELFFLYTPDGTDFVCIEPWTKGLGAYGNLNNKDWQASGVVPVIQPGERKVLRASFSVEGLEA